MTNIQILLFASLISAVDPVTALAVFSEVHTVHLQYSYSSLALHSQYTCCTLTVHVQYTYRTRTVHLPYTYLHLQYTYNTLTVY